MSTTVKPLRIICVGNGIAGPVFAMALQKTSKYSVILVDAGPEESKPIGGPITVAPNGMAALRFIEADHIVSDSGVMQESFGMMQGETGETLVHVQTGEIFTKQYGYGTYGISRQVFCQRLRELAKKRGIEMLYDMRLESIEETTDSVTAHFNKGSLTGDLIIGCDGLKSVTRKYVVGEEIKPRFTNLHLVGGLAKFTAEEAADLDLPRSFLLHFGTMTTSGFYPTNEGENEWGWFVSFYAEEPLWGETGWSKDQLSLRQVQDLGLAKCKDWKSPYLNQIIPHATRAFMLDIYDRDTIESWNRGRVVLCGDAAHPVSPIGGQGSQMAMESAVILARLLAEHEPSDDLFRKYMALRKPRTNATLDNGRRIIRFSTSGRLWGIFRDFFMRNFGGFVIKRGLVVQYGFDAGTTPL